MYSEFFKIAYVDVIFHGMQKPLGEQKLELIVNRRKNRPYRHSLERETAFVSLVVRKGRLS